MCTKESHPPEELHLNEETGWVWQGRTRDQDRLSPSA
jgi:hypothetical protein